MLTVTLPSRDTPDKWMDAADLARAQRDAFANSGSHALAKIRHQDAEFCNRQAMTMLKGEAA